MKKVTYLVIVLFSAVLLTSCAMAVSPVNGGLYTGVKIGQSATSNPGASKIGKGTCSSLLGIIAFGDCSIATAARNAGISKIRSVDFRSTSILGLYAAYTIMVHGE